MKSKLAVEQAVAALRAGDAGDAERVLRKHLLEYPQDAAALTKLAELAIDRRHIEEATILLRRAAGADPTPFQRMILIQHLQRYVGAQPVLDEIETLPPGLRTTFDVLAIEAGARGFLGEHDRQIAIYERLAEINPGNPSLWKTLGDTYKTVGRFDDAVAAVRRAVEACPTYGEGWWTLSNFKSFQFSDRDISAMKKALRGKLSDEDALHFHFALGKAFEDRNDWLKSFQHYDAGNRIRAKNLMPDAMRITGFVDRAIAALTPQVFAHFAGAGHQAADPIFVLGLHRSGSTLIEQILASHPLIEGTAELTVIQQIWERLGRMAAPHGRGPFQELLRLDHDAIRKIGEEYIERTRFFRSTGKPHFVDKLPANWMNLGIIRLALPNAKIIDARRHPMACGFSNFKQNYAAGINFSYSQDSIGHFYRDYVRFMDHIEALQPGAVHRVLNERLIDDPESEVRRMLDFIGVPFDPACLEFHRNTRAVQTPSAEQVRRPINRDGVDYWKHYEPWLTPMKEALGDALESWDKTPVEGKKRTRPSGGGRARRALCAPES
jgi:tetratricopeptide (TPR) repeat protein